MDTEEELYDVVISGVSGKFPSCDNLDELKQKLLEKINLVTDQNCRWNKDEWNVPSATGQVSVVKKFDDTFFGIYSGVAGMMDPLTRVAIERAYEAIMDAGVNPKSLRSANIAVYTNSCISDSEAVGCDEKLTAKFWLLAHVRALLANRISYVLNLQGPSWTIDSTWVGGIECLKSAVHDIKVGRVDGAIVGVSNVIMFPDLSQHWLGLNKLSPDGTCKPYQEDANGYGRSEGVVFLFLQRANEAKRIYAHVSHVDATFCGEKANTFLKPREEAFADFFKKFYNDYPVPMDDIAYLEADGSADKYLDEIELNAIGDVICSQRKETLPIGSVKSNLGHTEGSASLMSIAKTLICLDSGVIPPNLDFDNPNKNIKKLQTNEMKIVTNQIPFPNGKLAAVNCVGLCSSVGHVLLKPNSKEKKLVVNRNEQIPRLVLVSARHEPGILGMIDKLESMPYDAEYFSMINDVFRESMTGHFYRGFTILGATEKKIHFTLESGTVHKRPVWYVFAGMGSQWPGMGADLMNLPVFAETIKELDSYLRPLGIDIVNVITSFDPTVLKDVVNSFVGIAAVQIGMVDVLKAVGIEPDGMFGHSLGENGCAYADGCFTRYQTIMAAYFRGKASQETPLKKGLMAAVGLGYDKLTDLPENVQIACHNSADSTTISGPLDEVQAYMDELKRQNIFVRAVNSNYVAYHSRQVRPLAPFVLENVSKVVPEPKKRSSRWISTSVPEQNWNTPAAQYSSAQYHVNNFLGTVYFAEACAHIPEEAIVIEISPHGLFQGILKRTAPESCFCIPLGKREISSPLNFLLSSIGKLYVVGLQPDVNAIYPAVEYPVAKGTPSLATLATWNHENDWELNVYPDTSKIKPLEISLRDQKWRFLTGYKIQNKILVPFTLFLFETLQAYETNDPILVFENVNIENFVEVTTNNCVSVYTQVQYGSGNFEITQDNTVIMNGTLKYSQENLTPYEESSENDLNDCITFNRNEIQEIFQQHSMYFSQQFSRIVEIIFTNEGCHASLIWEDNLSYLINTIAHVIMLYDLCTKESGAVLPSFFLRLAIEMEKYSNMQSGTVVNITYDKNTNIVKGPGLELAGFRTTFIPATSSKNDLLLQDIQFVPYNNPQTQSIENFFNLCGQIIGETFYTEVELDKSDKLPPVNVILANDLNEDKFHIKLLLEMLYRELPETQIDVTVHDEKHFKNGKRRSAKYSKYFIVCEETESFANGLSQIGDLAEDVFLLCFGKKSKTLDQFIKITEEDTKQYTMSLWKKKIPINENVLKISPYKDSHWLEDLEEDLYGVTSQKSILLQWNSDYVVDVMDVINQISAAGPVHSLRYLVIMDKDAPPYSKDSEFYQSQLEKGLKMNIYKDGTWGSIRHLSLVRTLSMLTDIQKFALRAKKLKDINVEYISVHKSYQKTRYPFDNNVYEFSGTKISNKRKVMGLVNLKDNDTSDVNPLLSWSVPEQWSLEDAVTIPLTYVKAYYALVIQGKMESGFQVLVHNGHSMLGEACIAISLSLECEVFTSVDTNEQANYLMKRFPKSEHLLRIFSTQEKQIDIEVLKATGSKGVDIIVNAENERQVKQSASSLKHFGVFIHSSQNDVLAKSELGMSFFLTSATMHGQTNLSHLQSQPHIISQLQRLVDAALKCNIITPFQRTVYEALDELQINRALAENDSSRSLVIKKISEPNQRSDVFLCDSEKTYLIIGNKTEIWFSLITWLLQHNARKLVLIEETYDENDYNQFQKRFEIFIQNYPDLSTIRLSSSCVNNKEETIDMIRTVNNLAPLDLAFCLSLDEEQMNNLNSGLTQYADELRQLICLQCDASKVSESRHQKSLPALNIIWDRSITESAFLIRSIEKIVNSCWSLNSPLIYMADSSQFCYKFDHSKLTKIGEFLPQYSEIDCFENSFSTTPVFEKVVSKVSDYDTRTQLFPIFVIPGLHSKRIQPIIKNLMYPVFCAKSSLAYLSPRNTAMLLIQALKQIQPTGPYTIIGESWGGVVAMELTSLLEQNHEDRVQLILIEGIPKDMQDKLTVLGKFGSREFLDNLCELCFDQKINKAVTEDDKYNIDKDQMKFLELLQRKLTSIYHYSPSNLNINSQVIAVKSLDDDVLNTYINFEGLYGPHLDLKIFKEEKYIDLLESKALSTVINDNVLFKW
ncbi:fatty acid synthase-like [Planococcus citri]|uniref:fatty acid synthase-like n=1 Tax=Planococcus citri TaxID=170843 RepID=UPI0031F772D1